MPEHLRHGDDTAQTPEQNLSQDVINFVKLHRKSGLPDTLETITAEIRREQGDERAKFAQAVSQQIQIEKGTSTSAATDAVALVPEAGTASTGSSEQQELSPELAERMIRLLRIRFEAPENKVFGLKNLDWNRVEAALRATPRALKSVYLMEQGGHIPTIYRADMSGFDIGTLEEETTPSSTRNCVFSEAAAEWLKTNRPDEQFNGSAEAQAKAMGVDIMSTSQCRYIMRRNIRYFDPKTSRWFKTSERRARAGYGKVGNCEWGMSTCAIPRAGWLRAGSMDSSKHYQGTGWGASLRVNFTDVKYPRLSAALSRFQNAL